MTDLGKIKFHTFILNNANSIATLPSGDKQYDLILNGQNSASLMVRDGKVLGGNWSSWIEEYVLTAISPNMDQLVMLASSKQQEQVKGMVQAIISQIATLPQMFAALSDEEKQGMKDQLLTEPNPFDDFDPQTLSPEQTQAIKTTLDQVAPQLAKDLNIPVETFYPQWMKPSVHLTLADRGLKRPLVTKKVVRNTNEPKNYIERQFDFKGLDKNYLKAADRLIFWGGLSWLAYTLFNQKKG